MYVAIVGLAEEECYCNERVFKFSLMRLALCVRTFLAECSLFLPLPPGCHHRPAQLGSYCIADMILLGL